jgi:hypothetical protein
MRTNPTPLQDFLRKIALSAASCACLPLTSLSSASTSLASARPDSTGRAETTHDRSVVLSSGQEALPLGQEALPLGQTKTPPTATWVGFRVTGPKSSAVYVHLTDVVQVKNTKHELTLTFTLKNTQIQVKNNQNPLLTSHFETVVQSARLKPAGKDVQLIIVLKKEATMTSKVVQESDGIVLYVEFSEA